MRTMLRIGLALLVAQAFSTVAFAQTAKARIVDQEAAAEVKKFKTGDRVLLQWSGYEAYADAIRRVMPYTESRNANDRFLLPVELASNETPNQYLTFRLRVPAGSAPALKAVKPGEWITVTSSHKATGETDAAVSARPYVTTTTPATN